MSTVILCDEWGAFRPHAWVAPPPHSWPAWPHARAARPTYYTHTAYILHTHTASRLGSPASRSARPTSTGPFVIKALNFGHELASVFESLRI